jgi:hypothetical protein
MPTLPSPKQAATGGMLLALGVAIGAAVGGGHDAPRLDTAALAASVDDSKPIDVAAYHRTVSAVRAGRTDIIDLLTPEVAPGATVTTSVNVELGMRPSSVEYTAAAAGHFETVSLAYLDLAGSQLRDGTAIPGATRFVLTARNTSAEVLRLTAFVHYANGPTR